MKFRVEVRETYTCFVDVEARDYDEAKSAVEKRVCDGDIVVLDSYSYLDSEIVPRQCPDVV